jgi:hypothetical protein
LLISIWRVTELPGVSRSTTYERLSGSADSLEPPGTRRMPMPPERCCAGGVAAALGAAKLPATRVTVTTEPQMLIHLGLRTYATELVTVAV